MGDGYVPRRVQRRRSKGWKVPVCGCGCGRNAILVSRPGPWGNPFVVNTVFCGPTIRELRTVTEVVAAYRDLLTRDVVHVSCWDQKFVVAQAYAREHLQELAGHDLMCWCSPSEPCHADVLLELANRGAERGGGVPA